MRRLLFVLMTVAVAAPALAWNKTVGVPEPGTLGLLAIALAPLAVRVWRRR